MAREGIYVGGKEIVRRYVGDKIVWRKSYYAQVFSRGGDIETNETSGGGIVIQIYSYWSNFYKGTIDDGRLEIDGNIAYFSRLEADLYTDSYNNRTYNRIFVTFPNQSDKNKFLWKKLTNIKIFKKEYK